MHPFLRHAASFTNRILLLALTAASASSAPGPGETIRIPKLGNPALTVQLPTGWTAEYGNVSVKLTPGDGPYALVLGILPAYQLKGKSAVEYADAYFELAHDNPYSATEPITIDGKSGTVFVSETGTDAAPRTHTRLGLVPVDEENHAMLLTVELAELSPAQHQELEAVLAAVRIVGLDAGPNDAEVCRLPKTDNPALQIRLPPGWTATDAGGPLLIHPNSDNFLVVASMVSFDQPGTTPMTAAEIAKTALEVPGYRPYSATEPGTLAGKPGTVFLSGSAESSPKKFDTRMLIVQVDPLHFAVLQTQFLAPLSPAEAKQLDGMVGEITLRGEAPAAALAKGMTASSHQDYDLAIACYNEALRLDPNYAAAFTRRGIASALQGNYAQALSDYSQAIALNPGLPHPFALRGASRARSHDYANAISDYDEAIRLDPGNPSYLLFRGRAHAALHDYARAVADFDEAIRLKPAAPEPYSARATVSALQGDYQAAVADFNEALRLRPDHAGLNNSLAWLRATARDEKVRDGVKAVELATKACKLSEWKEPSYVDTLAAAYAECGNFDEAVKWETAYLAGKLDKEHAAQGHERLKLYQQKLPYREGPNSPSPTSPSPPKS